MLIDSVCILVFLVYLLYVKKKKSIINPFSFIVVGFFLPLFLYNRNWSTLIDDTNSGWFNYVIVSFSIIILFSFVILKNRTIPKITMNDKVVFTRAGKMLSDVIPILWIFVYLLENYLATGYILPAIMKIDAHKISLPIISYFTNCLFLPVAFCFLAYKASSRKRYLYYLIVSIMLPVISRSARMQVVICVLQCITLFILFEKKKSNRNIKLDFKKILLISMLGVLLFFLVALTTYRMNHYGKYNLNFGTEIGYTGPDLFGIMPIYYGYFPMSFNNLKLNILYNQNVVHNYVGLYSFSCFWFGILQFDNIFGIPTNGYTIGRLVSSGSATVATGLWEFWYDYGALFFIPLIASILITKHIENKAFVERNNVVRRVLYAWYIPMWFFTSFQNVLFQSINIAAYFIIYYLFSKNFRVVSEEKK